MKLSLYVLRPSQVVLVIVAVVAVNHDDDPKTLVSTIPGIDYLNANVQIHKEVKIKSAFKA
jgi:hypothetical protein